MRVETLIADSLALYCCNKLLRSHLDEEEGAKGAGESSHSRRTCLQMLGKTVYLRDGLVPWPLQPIGCRHHQKSINGETASLLGTPAE